MPFDGTDFPKRRPGSSGAKPSDNLVSAFIIVVAFSLLVLPISLSALVDIVRYVHGH